MMNDSDLLAGDRGDEAHRTARGRGAVVGARANETTLVRCAGPVRSDIRPGSRGHGRLLELAEPEVALWKRTALVVAVLFPVAMFASAVLGHVLEGRSVSTAALVGYTFGVTLPAWPLMRTAICCMGWWLRPAPAARRRHETLGTGIVLALYAIELATFMLAF